MEYIFDLESTSCFVSVRIGSVLIRSRNFTSLFSCQEATGYENLTLAVRWCEVATGRSSLSSLVVKKSHFP